jgi:hypothetical protein
LAYILSSFWLVMLMRPVFSVLDTKVVQDIQSNKTLFLVDSTEIDLVLQRTMIAKHLGGRHGVKCTGNEE